MELPENEAIRKDYIYIYIIYIYIYILWTEEDRARTPKPG